jgi:hypothetical protein
MSQDLWTSDQVAVIYQQGKNEGWKAGVFTLVGIEVAVALMVVLIELRVRAGLRRKTR